MLRWIRLRTMLWMTLRPVNSAILILVLGNQASCGSHSTAPKSPSATKAPTEAVAEETLPRFEYSIAEHETCRQSCLGPNTGESDDSDLAFTDCSEECEDRCLMNCSEFEGREVFALHGDGEDSPSEHCKSTCLKGW